MLTPFSTATTDSHEYHVDDNCAETISPTAAGLDAGVPAPVDLMALLARCMGNMNLIVRVLARFRDTGCADLEQLAGAIDRHDFAAVAEIAHRLKGAAG